MGLFSRSKPKIKIQTTKKDGYSGWIKCTHCHEMIHANELQQNIHCCPKCDYHYRLSALQRVASFLDEGKSFTEKFTDFKPLDPLQFSDTENYTDRIAAAQASSGRDEAIIVGTGFLQGREVALAVLDFSFMAGSMGSVVGERLTSLIEWAIEKKLPLVVISASGGARMQESIFSLMQMAKTSAALAKLHEAKLPYISILTNPTTGGVTASFASLGDVIIAEPDALICFAGPRVVEQVIKQKLPKGAQRSEFLLDKGMVDCIVHRKDLRERVSTLLDFFLDNERSALSVSKEEEDSLPVLSRKLRQMMEQPKKEMKELVSP
ncbi:MAG: acetyl-CoA carboxylase carboxyltransferase subunit beta [Chlamydiae bacterium]|nr:acetyl-CoA carboxylase carboxyltransferase subunit beta [Chlamydiota bacterium]